MNITLRKVTTILDVDVVDIVQINIVKIHAPQAGYLPSNLRGFPWLPRLLYDSRHFFQALLRGVHAWQLHALLVLIGHLDGQVLEEPRVVLDFWNGYSLHEANVEYKKLLKAHATCSQQAELFDEKYLLRISDKYAGQQMSAFH